MPASIALRCKNYSASPSGQPAPYPRFAVTSSLTPTGGRAPYVLFSLFRVLCPQLRHCCTAALSCPGCPSCRTHSDVSRSRSGVFAVFVSSVLFAHRHWLVYCNAILTGTADARMKRLQLPRLKFKRLRLHMAVHLIWIYRFFG